jgi:hypothetical protein
LGATRAAAEAIRVAIAKDRPGSASFAVAATTATRTAVPIQRSFLEEAMVRESTMLFNWLASCDASAEVDAAGAREALSD